MLQIRNLCITLLSPIHTYHYTKNKVVHASVRMNRKSFDLELSWLRAWLLSIRSYKVDSMWAPAMARAMHRNIGPLKIALEMLAKLKAYLG